MKIARIEIFTAPPPRSWMSPVMVRINTDEGVAGIGEVALAYGLGGEAGARMVKDFLPPRLIMASGKRGLPRIQFPSAGFTG